MSAGERLTVAQVQILKELQHRAQGSQLDGWVLIRGTARARQYLQPFGALSTVIKLRDKGYAEIREDVGSRGGAVYWARPLDWSTPQGVGSSS